MNKLDKITHILLSDKPSILIKENENLFFELIPELEHCKGFEQNNDWHIYDVYEHILHVVDGVDNDLVLRLAALFHDIGKPSTYKEDSEGIGHFYNHWNVSCDILNRYDIEDKHLISMLVYYHDINIDKLSMDEINKMIDDIGQNNIHKLFILKRSDLLAQNSKYHNLLEKYNKQEEKIKEIILNRYIESIKEIYKDKLSNIELISQSNNIVFKVTLNDETYEYVKIYLNNSSHIDHELSLYDKVDNKYLKEKIYSQDNPKMAIYKELIGKTIDELNYTELEQYNELIIDSLIDFFESISNYKSNGYGILDKNMQGKYNTFIDFLKARQQSTSLELKDYPFLECIFGEIFNKYSNLFIADNSLVPIDTNLKNIILLEDGSIKFSDPGELISGPILMGYGDFVAHTYKTILYDNLIKKLNLNEEESKLIHIYAIFSSLNILAFLHKLGVSELESVIPYGNNQTFFTLISEHLKEIDLDDINKKYIKS